MPVPPVNRKARDQAARERRSLITDGLFELPENYNFGKRLQTTFLLVKLIVKLIVKL